MEPFLYNNDREMHSTHNEKKIATAKTFIRTIKLKIYKCMTLISKKVCIDKLDHIVIQ